MAADAALRVRALARALSSFEYRFSNEIELQDGIEVVLKKEGMPFEREVRASAQDRFDFLVERRLVIEVKVDGTLSAALLQADRYAIHDGVDGLILATTQRWGLSPGLPSQLRGKPFAVAKLRGVVF